MKCEGALVAALIAAAPACVPELDVETGVLRQPRILALRGIPAEARPGETVRYEALVADPGGAGGAANFSYCTRARNADERTGVSQTCLAGESLVAIGAETEVPRDACALFGPNTPPSEDGEPPRRPSDPDPSGGYFVPVRAEAVTAEAQPSFGFQRVRCDLAGATRDIFEAFEERYAANEHPQLRSFWVANTNLLGRDQPAVVPAGDTVLRVQVPETSLERYVVYSANDSALFDAEEQIAVDWYASAGVLGATRTTIDPVTQSSAIEITLEAGTEATIWVVLRDSRGGSAWFEAFVSATTP